MKCSVCNTDNGCDILFCQGCGRKIPRCPTCGTELTTRDKFCTVDGTRLSDDLLLLVPEEAVLSAPVWTRAGSNAPAAVTRPVEAEIPENTVRAGGGSAVPAFSDWEERPVVPEAPKRAFCEKCGKRIAPGTRYCADCDPTRRRKVNKGNQKMKVILIIMLILLLLAGLCAGGYALINSDLFDWDTSSSNRVEKDDDEDEDEEDPEDTAGGKDTEAPGENPTDDTPAAGVEDPVNTQPATEPSTQPPVEDTQPAMTPLNYWIENCDKQYLRDADLEGFDKQMCVYARNAIYAKSGRMFNSKDLQRYFSQFSWYNPIISPDRFSDSMLNAYQLANLNVILAYERAHGYS